MTTTSSPCKNDTNGDGNCGRPTCRQCHPENFSPDPQTKLKRLLWIAFQASQPMGLGVFHASISSKETEDSLFYGFRERRDINNIQTDYVLGRMMKTTFTVTDDGVLSVRPESPRIDYQSWAAKYRTGAELIAATEASFR